MLGYTFKKTLMTGVLSVLGITNLMAEDTKLSPFLPNQYRTLTDGAIYSLVLQFIEPFTHSGEEIFNFWWDKEYKIHIHITGDKVYGEYLRFVERSMKRSPRKPTGSDKDVNGCIGSAGYQWCAKTNKCERPWELGKKEKIKNEKKAFDTYCGNK